MYAAHVALSEAGTSIPLYDIGRAEDRVTVARWGGWAPCPTLR
ncbi:hypothetical protein [Streptomyces sp. ST2-7A]|nr:hypothetical protein [Streptomyces sp. ST2-7A]